MEQTLYNDDLIRQLCSVHDAQQDLNTTVIHGENYCKCTMIVVNSTYIYICLYHTQYERFVWF